METSVAVSPGARRAFSGLIDYAGLFPPAELAMPQAQAEYVRARSGPHAWMLGRFIVPLSALSGAQRNFPGAFSAIAKFSEIESVAALRSEGVAIDSIEIPLITSDEGEGALREMLQERRATLERLGLSDVPVYIEFLRLGENGLSLESALSTAAAARFGAKLRCGGITADAFPTVDDVARFIGTAVAANVPFKATAGLHHPVRHLNAASGFVMHGFINILAAAALAPRVDLAMLTRIVAEEDSRAFTFEPAAMRWRNERVDLADLTQARERAFVSYGSCSFAEPVDDLTALGILAR
ncbi:MAG TPA: hypothetical protein VHX17_06295 [Candidatus Cybelea sp.]|nr:hypothetical protein [Candidatus Cybelea sp.]